MSDEREQDGIPGGPPVGASAPWSVPGRASAAPGPAVPGPGTGSSGAPPPPSGPPSPPYGAPPPPSGPLSPSQGAPPGPSSPFTAGTRERERVFAGPGYTSAGLRNDGFAVAAMVLGIAGIVLPGVCLLAIALGHVGLHRLRTSYSGGRGLAVAGLVLGYAGLAIWVCVLLLYLALRAFTFS